MLPHITDRMAGRAHPFTFSDRVKARACPPRSHAQSMPSCSLARQKRKSTTAVTCNGHDVYDPVMLRLEYFWYIYFMLCLAGTTPRQSLSHSIHTPHTVVSVNAFSRSSTNVTS